MLSFLLRVLKKLKHAASLQSSFNPDYSLGFFFIGGWEGGGGGVGEEVGVLETKEFSCSNLHLGGGDRVVRERENQKAGNSRLRINARSSPR